MTRNSGAGAYDRSVADAQGYAVVGGVLVAGVLIFVLGMTANRMLRPQAPTTAKLKTYESGVDPVGSGWAQSHVRYYLYAFLYVVFAVDAVYLFPWVTVVERFGWATLLEMGVFLGILAVSYTHLTLPTTPYV